MCRNYAMFIIRLFVFYSHSGHVDVYVGYKKTTNSL